MIAFGRTSLVVCALVGGCSGDTTEEQDPPQWWNTCGDPACGGYSGPFPGVPDCTDEVVGEECSAEGAECDPHSDCNALVTCAIDNPIDPTSGCPISLAASKADITYLDHTSLRTAADEALAIRLATWRYRTEDPSVRPHLGFVIDDRPASPAVATDGRRIDLYAYASLALAAVQVQEAEIAALRREVEELRATCAPR